MLVEKASSREKSRKSRVDPCFLTNETKSSCEEVQVDKSLTWSTRLLYFFESLELHLSNVGYRYRFAHKAKTIRKC
jgi:hypothetical protein